MSRAVLLATLALLLSAAPAGAQWGDAPLPGDGSAICPDVAGTGWLSALGAGARKLTLWRTDQSGGAVVAGSFTLPSHAVSCPAVDVADDGSALVAVVVDGARLVVLRRSPAGELAPVAGWRVPGSVEVAPAVAVSPGGAGVVAWLEHGLRSRARGPVAGSRLVVRSARFAGGAAALPARVDLLPKTDVAGSWIMDPLIAADAAADGTATVAWTTPRPSRRGGAIGGLAAVDVATAPPGAPFGAAQRVAEDRQEIADLALDVAPGGRALLAHDGTEGVGVFERVPGGRFAFLASYGDVAAGAARPAVAIADDGSAVVAWREWNVVRAASRVGAAAFGEPATVAAERTELGFGVAVPLVGGFAGIMRDDEALDAVVSPGGRAALAWMAAPEHAGGPFGATVATSVGGAFGRVTRVGGPVRDVRAFAPLIDAAGPGLLWSDDRSPTFLLTPGSARGHLSRPDTPAADPPPPAVRVLRHSRALYPAQSLRVTVACSASCEVRARVPGTERAAEAIGVGGRRDAGPVTLELDPEGIDLQIARRHGRLRLRLDVAAPGGTRVARRTARLRVVPRPLPPYRVPLDVRALRHGDDVIVTWRTAGPARQMTYLVASARSRKGRPGSRSAAADVRGRGAMRFRVRLHDVAETHRHVVIYAIQVTRNHRTVVPIED